MKTSKLLMAVMITANGAVAQERLTPQNIDKVVREMTIEEKANILVGYSFGESYFGLPTNPDPNAGAIVLGAAGNTGKVERLGIPHTVLADGPAGLHIEAKRPDDPNTYYCTGFPIGTLLAATWNTDLVYQVGKAMGNEVLEYGCDVILGPGMNLMRNPLCGRNFEYYSEDPFLTGYIAAAMVNGIQSNGVGVSAKHFAANNQETNRLYNNSVVSQRALRELYLKGFEIMVRKSQPWTIMSSYNYINGVWAQESYDLLTTILRDEWGFKGIVMTDWTNTRHTAAQVAAGNDLLTPGNATQIEDIIKGAKDGTIKMDDINRNVKRVLQYIVKTPHFRGYPYSNKPDIEAHAALTRKAAPEGMVLLKNEHDVLPLRVDAEGCPNEGVHRIALFGITSYKFYAGGTGSGDVNKPYVVDLKEGLLKAGFVTDDTLNIAYEKYKDYGLFELEAEMGSLSSNTFFPRPRLKEPQMGRNVYAFAAKNNDLAIITIGRSSGEAGDRSFDDFYINPDEQEMIGSVCEEFHKAGKKVVVILNTGGAVEMESWRDKADAILLAWQPGMEGGNSIADVLTGKTYPSGRLPVTFPVRIEDVPSTKNFPKDYTFWDDMQLTDEQKQAWPNVCETVYDEELNVGYRYFQTVDKKVSFPFGFGLSYTTFEYENPKITRIGNTYYASVTVKNEGRYPGKDVVQLYVTAPEGKLEKPALELKAFAKTPELRPGEMARVEMTFINYDLASYDEELQAFVTDGGTYQAHFAVNAAKVFETVPFSVKGKAVKCHSVLKKQQGR